MPEVEKKTLSFKADPWMVEWIRGQAREERRTVGAMIRIMLEQHIGFINTEEDRMQQAKERQVQQMKDEL